MTSLGKMAWSAFFAILMLAAAAVGSWYYRGQVDEARFAERLTTAPHKTDTVTIERLIPQRPTHFEAQIPVGHPVDTSRVLELLLMSRDSLKSAVIRMASPMDTSVVGHDSSRAVIHVDPLARMMIIDLLPGPTRKIIERISDSVFVPVPVVEHDSWLTRAALVSIGAGLSAVLFSITK